MGLAAGLLGSHVSGRADDGAAPRLVRVVPEAFGQAEVGDLGAAVGGQENVGRLEVAVDDALAVGGVDGAGDYADGRRGLSDVLRPAADPSSEAATVDEFKPEKGETAGLANVVDPHDVGVLEGSDGLGLVVEPRQGVGSGPGSGQDHLERDQTFKLSWRAL